MRLWEAHHRESHHGERINTAYAEILHPAQSSELIWGPCVRKIELFNSDEPGNFSVCLICLTAGTLIANDSINKSQHCHCKSEISSLFLS